MPKSYKVKKGDCISSIAFKYGFFPDTIWFDANNSKLKDKRGDPNTLRVGDEVHVPDLRVKEISCADSAKHSFRRKGVPEMLKLQFKVAGAPRKDEAYILEVDGQIVSKPDDKTDAEGRIEQVISPDAKLAIIQFHDGTEKYTFALGEIDPVDTVRGVKGRLISLGHYSGRLDDSKDKKLTDAVMAFQAANDLEVTGEIDAATEQKIVEKYGS
jgi:murein DD-endopeptidase MepM/ murein hydrolase activator NlpD